MSKEYVLRRLEALGLIDKQQITQAFITMYTTSLKKDGFPVCELRLKGISPKLEADIVSLSVSLDGDVVKKADIPVVKGDSARYKVTVDPSVIEKLSQKSVECSVLALDKYGRELISASSIIEFDIPRKEPVIKTNVSFVNAIKITKEDIRTDIAEVVLSTDTATNVCIELYDSDKVLWQSNINIAPDLPITHKVSVDSAEIGDSGDFRIVVKNNGNKIAEESKTITIEREQEEEEPEPKDIPNIIGDLILPDFVDTHTVTDDRVSIGALALFNKGTDSDIIVSVILDGTDLLCSREHMMSEDRQIDISAPFSRLANEDTYTCEMIAHVTDASGNILIHKVSTLKVRSKYDMNLREIRLRSAQFVNPRNKAVTDMVGDSDGLLATSMNGRYMVQGYQNGGKDVIRQMEAVYKMMFNMNMRYVSDTFTFNKSTENYQHVRTPDKVLSDKSGNCLELCILYASFMEAMGLESVIAFPPGHAIVGVVLGTDVYDSKSDYDGPDDAPYVAMDIAGKKAFVMFVETTMCPFNGDFLKAVTTAEREIEDNIDSIDLPKNHVFIKQMRLNGTDPIIGL